MDYDDHDYTNIDMYAWITCDVVTNHAPQHPYN